MITHAAKSKTRQRISGTNLLRLRISGTNLLRFLVEISDFLSLICGYGATRLVSAHGVRSSTEALLFDPAYVDPRP